jgi:TRAP-type C4-dicarboxylate transport system substrate-binding protein
MVPGDIKCMKIRPAHATMGQFVTLLGGSNVQSSAPEVRDILEKGVADAVTFPWGSILLFKIDSVTKFHMDVPLYATTFAWVMNKAVYEKMSANQKKVIDEHCSTDWALKVAAPWAEYEAQGRQKLKAAAGHEVYPISAEQLAQWRAAAAPLEASWAADVTKAGHDAKTVFNELKTALGQYKAAY